MENKPLIKVDVAAAKEALAGKEFNVLSLANKRATISQISVALLKLDEAIGKAMASGITSDEIADHIKTRLSRGR